MTLTKKKAYFSVEKDVSAYAPITPVINYQQRISEFLAQK